MLNIVRLRHEAQDSAGGSGLWPSQNLVCCKPQIALTLPANSSTLSLHSACPLLDRMFFVSENVTCYSHGVT